jgi:hypothetical protein
LWRAGAREHGIQLVSMVAGGLRLLVVGVGVAAFLPSRLARVIALATAALIPASVHIDGMINGEALLGLWAAIAMLFGALCFRATRPWPAAIGLGVACGLALLTKISALALLSAMALAVGFDALRGTRNARRTIAFAAALAVMLAVSGWYYGHQRWHYGKTFVTSFDAAETEAIANTVQLAPWERRPVSFLLWSTEIYRSPHYPTGLEPEARLVPVLIASTFVDYYNYFFEPLFNMSFAGHAHNASTKTALAFSRVSVAGGTVLALAATAAFFGALVAALRQRRADWLFLLSVPLFAALGQVYFATRYPIDSLGVIKGAYLQFASPPLCALVGAAAAWLWARGPLARAAASLVVASLAAVASYTFYCRLAPLF